MQSWIKSGVQEWQSVIVSLSQPTICLQYFNPVTIVCLLFATANVMRRRCWLPVWRSGRYRQRDRPVPLRLSIRPTDFCTGNDVLGLPDWHITGMDYGPCSDSTRFGKGQHAFGRRNWRSRCFDHQRTIQRYTWSSHVLTLWLLGTDDLQQSVFST